MDLDSRGGSRRSFVADAGRLASVAALAGCASRAGTVPPPAAPAVPSGQWDLSWIATIERATDRAVFDWPSMGDPADPMVFQLAERFLDNCAAVYRAGTYDARVVLNIRTQAVGAALTDATWERFALGAEYSVKDHATQQPATRNPFRHRAPDPAPGIRMPTLDDLLGRGAIVLVCDFALGHLARRLATKAGRTQDEVHRELRAGFVPGAFAVPSGIYGLARAQNSGCALIRM